jgi:hypothetical protein
MSQILTPVNGGVIPQIQTSTGNTDIKALSSQYIRVNELESRPTEWNVNGRPIYRRLPSTSENYQIFFYNVVTESNVIGNTFVGEKIEEVGYVYIPAGNGSSGVGSLEVVPSGNKENLLLNSGDIVWKFGSTKVLPTIVNLSVLGVGSGAYDLAYQLSYDDSPVPLSYSVTDFSLEGQPLTITSSTDDIIGWRKVAKNAFLGSNDLSWSNEDLFFHSNLQPAEAYIGWESELSHTYEKVTLRCPVGTSYSGDASLFYVENGSETLAQIVSVQKDSTGQYFEFAPSVPAPINSWVVKFSSPKVSIQAITVSGTLTLLTSFATPTLRSVLVMYPEGTAPQTVKNSEGEDIPVNYCFLAKVDVDDFSTIIDIEDRRSIINRDYTPVADWLTVPFDEDLIDMYEQVSDYSSLWMSPVKAMKQEYKTLTQEQITLEA